MVNWEVEFKKYIAKKFKDKLGFDMNVAEIKGFKINRDIDLKLLFIDDLALVYAFAVMNEDFERAKVIEDEVKSRDCDIKINTDDAQKTGSIDIYRNSDLTKSISSIQMIVLPDGMMIDFEKQNL